MTDANWVETSNPLYDVIYANNTFVTVGNQIIITSPVENTSSTESATVEMHNLDDDAEVTVAVSSSNTAEGTVSPATLTFTETNWDTAQTVTVTGVDDNNSDGHQDYDISLSELVVSSKALDFDGTMILSC